jgi:hypothetical protein
MLTKPPMPLFPIGGTGPINGIGPGANGVARAGPGELVDGAEQPLGSQPSAIPYPGLPASAPPAYGQTPPTSVDPVTGEQLSAKSKLIAGMLQLFLGGFGAGRFYTGHIAVAVGQLLTAWGVFFGMACFGVSAAGIGALPLMLVGFGWPLFDAIMMLTGDPRDSDGYRLRPD